MKSSWSSLVLKSHQACHMFHQLWSARALVDHVQVAAHVAVEQAQVSPADTVVAIAAVAVN
jgi:hypothetical protein